MKTIVITFCTLIAFAVPAFAINSSSGVSFPLYSSASGAVKTSAVYDVSGYKTKTLIVSGATLNSNNASTTFKNMSGTVIAQCSGTTSAGPYSTSVDNSYAQTAISMTSNGNMTWTDACKYLRLQWTSGTVGTKLKAILHLSD